jgi:Glycosyltransferase family 87
MRIVNIIHNLFHTPYFGYVLIICACFYYLKSEAKAQRKLIQIVFYSAFLIALFIFARTAIYWSYHPQMWDFGCFYLYGKVAATGHNFYSPENFHQVFNSLNLPFLNDKSFVDEVVNVGFPYPPPTILYFIPLGFLSFKTALIAWTIFNLIFVYGCLYLLYGMFLKSDRLNGLLFASALFFILLPSLWTMSSAQTNFISLFLLLLMKKYWNSKFAGIFLALAFFTKPFMIIFIVLFMVRRNWNAIIYFMLTSVALCGLTAAIFGTAPFVSYIVDSPIGRLPKDLLAESTKQSLLAVLIRSGLISMNKTSIYAYISVAVLLVTGAYLIFLVRRKLYDYIWALLVLIGLILYPNTQETYGVLLLFIIFQFFDKNKQLGFNLYLSIPITAIFYYLSGFSVFASMCFLLGVIIIKSFKTLAPASVVGQ